MKITKPTERKFFFENDPDEAWIILRYLNPGERADIFDAVFDQQVEYKKNKESGELEPVFRQSTNKKKDRETTFIKSIVEWGNFFDEDGSVLECTKDNIIRAMREIEGFIQAVQEFRATMESDIAQEREDQEKN